MGAAGGGGEGHDGRRAPTGDDCVLCGACCFSESTAYIQVFEVDWARMGPDARRYVEQAPLGAPPLGAGGQVRRHMRMAHGRCAALDLVPATGHYLCRLYDERPDPCRALVPGWSDCSAQRRDKALIAVDALRRRASAEHDGG